MVVCMKMAGVPEWLMSHFCQTTWIKGLTSPTYWMFHSKFNVVVYKDQMPKNVYRLYSTVNRTYTQYIIDFSCMSETTSYMAFCSEADMLTSPTHTFTTTHKYFTHTHAQGESSQQRFLLVHRRQERCREGSLRYRVNGRLREQMVAQRKGLGVLLLHFPHVDGCGGRGAHTFLI